MTENIEPVVADTPPASTSVLNNAVEAVIGSPLFHFIDYIIHAHSPFVNGFEHLA